MSEQKAGYNAGMIKLEDFKDMPSAHRFADPAYQRPTPGEVDQLIKAAGWSQTDVAKLVGVSYNPEKGSPTVRRWRAPLTSDQYREIPYSAWRLMLLAAGVVKEV